MGRKSSDDLIYLTDHSSSDNMFQLVRLPSSVDHCSEARSLNTPPGDGVC